jgi:dTDP-glucose 4,6-dehydratase
MAILITGGAGFIGSNFVLDWLKQSDEKIINLDKLTYAGNLHYLKSIEHDPRHVFIQNDINNTELVLSLLKTHQPCAIIHFAAESHVDRSIHSPEDFIHTNIMGTYRLLAAAQEYFAQLSSQAKMAFRFLHVSTDEVYGSLSPHDPAFTETHPYQPNSPYAASKASSDHLVRAYHHTYGLPTLITHCSNNYGPHQYKEKLIPLLIAHALSGKPLPIYGDGQNVRDWLYVSDHCEAIRYVLEKGAVGETYNIGGKTEKTNLAVVEAVCNVLNQQQPRPDGKPYQSQISFVTDRLGHDKRYAINPQKIEETIGWTPRHSFEDGLQETVSWYLAAEEALQ